MNLKARVDKALTEANARKAAERDAVIKDLFDWEERCIAREDTDAYWRYVGFTLQETRPEQSREAREVWGEYINWRDDWGASRTMWLVPLEICERVRRFSEEDERNEAAWESDLKSRRLYLACLYSDILREVGRLPDGEAVKMFKEHFEGLPPELQEADRCVTFHGLRYEAIAPYFPDVTRADYDELQKRITEPTDEQRKALYEHGNSERRLPDGLAERLADELHVMGT